MTSFEARCSYVNIKYAQKDLYIKDVFIKKDGMLNYMVLSNVQNKKYFSDPKKLDITIWKADGIGQYLALIESKIVISKILLQYRLKLNEKIIRTEWIAKITYGLSNQDYIIWEAR